MLNEKKDRILADIQTVKPDLEVSLIPNNLDTLRNAVDKMRMLKDESQGFESVFSSANEAEMFEADASLKQLQNNVTKRDNARRELQNAMEVKDFNKLKRAVRKASRAPFIEEDELVEARKLITFLNPEIRCEEVKRAMEEDDIEMLEKSLSDMKEAGVENFALEFEATTALENLKEQKRIEEKERRRAERERRRKERALNRLEACLQEAIESRDLETMAQAVTELDVSEFIDDEVPSAMESRNLLAQLKIERARSRLQDGIRTRRVDALYNALMDAKYGK